MWTVPKTIWKVTEFFNVEDYNRIKNNLLEIKNLAAMLYQEFDIEPMGKDKTYQDYSFYADELTRLEKNLDLIRRNTYPYWEGKTKEWYDNCPFPDAADLNRLETGCKIMYDSLLGQAKGRPGLIFRLGGGRCVCR